MLNYLVVIVVFALAVAFMTLALHFSKYKRRPSGCCGGGHCTTDHGSDSKVHSCYDEKNMFVENIEEYSNCR